jgi:superfamily II DNA/RNA helicase
MMDRLSESYSRKNSSAYDACLASNIIEVGVDIDRLSLMGVVGQPKNSSTYIQVTGRVGRRWKDRPGLILMIYNPSKSRDLSHYEHFHSYHRRLYENVEPTSATPFSVSALKRGFAGALIAWARQHEDANVQNKEAYNSSLMTAYQILKERCEEIQVKKDRERSLKEMEDILNSINEKWQNNPQEWESFPHKVDGEYLMLWPGQFTTQIQKQNGIPVPSSLRQVDGEAELEITQYYSLKKSE